VANLQAVPSVHSGAEVVAHLALYQLLAEALMAEVGPEYGVTVS
jgi:hypothetical protein